MKFKIGDRVIVNGESGTIIDYDTQFGSSEVLFYIIKFEDKLGNAIRYWYQDLQLDVARIRAEKISKLL